MTRYIALTGCCGFIGRNVARLLLERGDYVYGVDRLDYAADPTVVAELSRFPNFHLRAVDVRSLGRLPDVDTVIHCAASTHVDNSLTEAEEFVANNVGTTAKLLELVHAKAQHGMPHYVHVSTDETYGPAPAGATFTEEQTLSPSSPYAASKAAADMLVHAWGVTYGVPYAILRPTNCYGLQQHPEKLIPKAIRSLVLGRPIPIHGDGTQTRCWLDVQDAARAIVHAVDNQLRGVYNVGGNTEASVASVVAQIAGNMGVEPTLARAIRAGCDVRYAVDDTKLRSTGWTSRGSFWASLPRIVEIEKGRWRW